MDTEKIFVDILTPRRKELSNFLWVSRQIYPKLAWEVNKNPTPECHKEQVLKSRKIQEFLDKMAGKIKLDRNMLKVQCKEILDEIGYNKNLKVIRWLAIILIKICKKMCTGIYINQFGLDNVKAHMGSCPVIFVPSHRSYADFILISLICFSTDISIPAIAAGMDFYQMVGMGRILRNTGAFFMRRSYNNDELYWTVFKQYIYQIVTKGNLPIEFFIEGTRSRSGKSLMPKFGLLQMILKGFFLSQVPDILFIPINISYDRYLEEKLFAYELLGIPKPKESTTKFFKSLQIIKENYGNIYLNFGQPISTKEFFKNKCNQHNLGAIYQQELTNYEKSLIPSLAFEIIKQQQQLSTLSTFNLIAIIINNYIINQEQLDIERLIDDVNWLKELFESLNISIGFITVEDSLKIHQNLISNSCGKINLIWNEFNSNEPLKGHKFSNKFINYSVPFLMLQIYINPTIHYLIDIAIITLLVKGNVDNLYRNFYSLRSFFTYEFITYTNCQIKEYEEALKKSLLLNLIENKVENYELGNNIKLQETLFNILQCFIYSYYKISVFLKNLQRPYIEKELIIEIQKLIQMEINDYRQKKKFIHPYCANMDIIMNCLNILCDKKILKKYRNTDLIYEIINIDDLNKIEAQLMFYVCIINKTVKCKL